jgi:hypothetical protein
MFRRLRFAMLAGLSLAAASCQAEAPGATAPVGASAPVTRPTGNSISGEPLHVKATNAMPSPRAAHSATRLADGRVLIAGGCSANGCEEGIAGDAIVFDPMSSVFSPAGALLQPRVGHRAIALDDGSVLLFGGWTPKGVTALVERYLPDTGRFEPHGRMIEARDGFSATLLLDGSVLITGGYGEGMRRLATAERYDPATGQSRSVGTLAEPRMSHTATLLADGRVLVAGGSRSRQAVLASIEIFDPQSGAFAPAGNLARARHKHAAVALGDSVLLLGGASIPEDEGHFDDSEWWSPRGVVPGPQMAAGRYKFHDSLAVFDDGRVLVAGGGDRAEVLAADGSTFQPLDAAIGQRLAFATATLLTDGRALVAGGYDSDIRVSRQAWLVAGAMRTEASNTGTD